MRVKIHLDRGGSIATAFSFVLVMSIFGVQTVKASSPLEWTQNSTFVRSGYKWDLIVYNWEFLDPPNFDLPTFEVSPEWYDIQNYALWPQDGVVMLAASDPIMGDPYGRSARVTYGPFIDPYSDELPQPLSVTSTGTLVLQAVVSNYGSTNYVFPFWTGIKFDAWFRDPLDNNRKMMIEMYFHGTGIQGLWGNELFREAPLGNPVIDDHVIKLEAFPEYCTISGDTPGSNFAMTGAYSWSASQFTIDLKGIWQRAANHFGRSYADELYAVALDVETGMSFSLDSRRPVAFALLNQLKVIYTSGPNTPSTPSGPSSGHTGTSYIYTTSTTDPNGDSIRYLFDWGDGSFTWTGYYNSGATASASHQGGTVGSFPVKVRAQDDTGLYSNWSPSLTISISNNPPNTPTTPSGPTSLVMNKYYTYSTKTTDPDGDQVCYEFSWGDGTTTTTGYYASGATAYASHKWTIDGTLYIRVRSKDPYGGWSGWSSSLMVVVTYTCPTLLSWNGTAYEEEGLLDIHSTSDVTVDCTLSHIVPAGRLAMLSLRELDNFTSHIDYIKLYIADEIGNRHECSVIFARHNELGPVTEKLLYDDSTRVDIAPGERTDLWFLLPKDVASIQYFVFQINGYNSKPY